LYSNFSSLLLIFSSLIAACLRQLFAVVYL
jgi:hypothetical protein